MSRTAAGPTGETQGRTTAGPAVAHTPGRRLGTVLQGIAIALGLVLMLGGFALLAVEYRPYYVPTGSMEPTVQPGDTVVARRTGGSSPGRGDVVVFKDAQWGNAVLVKRVIAVGGDTLVCCDAKHRLILNGTPVDEPYIAPGVAGDSKFSVKVPQGRIFVMGDNRVSSLDSRVHLDQVSGTVPVSGVLGRVEGIAWPFDRMGLIKRTTAFDTVRGSGSAATPHGPLGPLAYATVAGGVLILATAALGPVAGLIRRVRRPRS